MLYGHHTREGHGPEKEGRREAATQHTTHSTTCAHAARPRDPQSRARRAHARGPSTRSGMRASGARLSPSADGFLRYLDVSLQYLTVSPRISLHLIASPRICPYPPVSARISYLPVSPGISRYLPVSRHIVPRHIPPYPAADTAKKTVHPRDLQLLVHPNLFPHNA